MVKWMLFIIECTIHSEARILAIFAQPAERTMPSSVLAAFKTS